MNGLDITVECPGVWSVTNKANGHIHLVVHGENGELWCDCQGWAFYKRCKHITAVKEGYGR